MILKWFHAGFDDLVVGMGFRTPWRTLEEKHVQAFVQLTGDTHPAHIDQEWAAATPFGERIVPGMLVLATAVGLARLDPVLVVAATRLEEVTFERPVKFGDSLCVVGEIRELAARGSRHGVVGLAWRIVTQDELVAVRLRVELLWKRAAAGSR